MYEVIILSFIYTHVLCTWEVRHMRPEIKELIERKFEFRKDFYDTRKEAYLYMIGFLAALLETNMITLHEWDMIMRNLKEWRDEGE